MGGLDALAEDYTPAAKEILLDLENPEKPAPAPAVTAPPLSTPILCGPASTHPDTMTVHRNGKTESPLLCWQGAFTYSRLALAAESDLRSTYSLSGFPGGVPTVERAVPSSALRLACPVHHEHAVGLV